MNVDPAKLEMFMGKLIGHMTGSALCYSIWLGDELGLYGALAATGPRNADSVAAQTGCNTGPTRQVSGVVPPEQSRLLKRHFAFQNNQPLLGDRTSSGLRS